MKNKLRIMHGITEIAGQNWNSVLGLRAIGEDAETVVLQEHPFGYPYDYCLGIDKSKMYLFPWYAVKLAAFLVKAVFSYDVFHFHFGRSICNNMDLWVYDLLGKKLFYEFHGSDIRNYREYCEKSGRKFIPELELSDKIINRNDRICAKAHQIILHDDELIPYLPEHHAPVQVVPLRVNIWQFEPAYPAVDNTKTIRIVHAPSNRSVKGTEQILGAVEKLRKKYTNIELVLVEGKTQKEAFEIYKTADIIIDQLFIETYGVFAIEGMAMGKPVVTYVSDKMRERLPEELPVVVADIGNIEEVVEGLIVDASARHDIGIRSRKYVEVYHDYRRNARILRDIYAGKLEPLTGRDAFDRVKNLD